MSRSVKIMIPGEGDAVLAPPAAPRGYAGRNPIVEITDVPDDVRSEAALAAYRRCVIMPIMHAEIPIPWGKIADAAQGQIIRLLGGRPVADPSGHKVRISITLSPAALAVLDARDNGRSQEIERLVMESVSQDNR